MASANNEVTTKFKVDISDLKKNIQDANRQIKLANAEFKSASASMDKWGNSAKGLDAKITQTEKVLKNQKIILNEYKRQLALVVEEYGENSKEADNMRIKVENQKATVIKTQKALGEYKDALAQLEQEQKEAAQSTDKQASAYDDLKGTIKDQETQLEKLKNEYKNVVLEQGKNSDSAQELAREIDDLSGELKENKTQMEKLDDAANDLDNSFEETSSGGLNTFGVMLGNLASNLITSVISKMGDLVTETFNVGRAFESSMSNVAALSGATGDELQMLEDTAREFGATTVFSASEAADALGYMALAGWDANQSSSALGGVLNLAAASGMGLAEASDMVTDYLSAFNMTADQSAYFADLLAYAQSNANTTAAGLGEAYRNCAANLNAAGQDVETVTSLLSMMANQGLKGSEAGTALSAVMRDMTAKMEDGAIAIGDTNVQVMDANGNYRDLTDILADVEAATDGLGDAERATALSSTFTSDSIRGLNLILNAGVDDAAAFEEELRNSSGTAQDMSDVMNDNVNGDLAELNSQFQEVQLTLYDKLEPAIRLGINALSKMVEVMQFLVDHSTEVLTVIAAVTAAIVAYTVVTQGATIAANLMATAQRVLNAVMSANPIGIVIALIAALVAAFMVLWNKSEAFRNFWITLFNTIKNVASTVINAVINFFKTAWEKIKAIWSVVVGFFTGIWNGIKFAFSTVINFFKNIFLGAWNGIKAIWNAVVGFFSGIWEGIKNVFLTVANFFRDRFEAGINAIRTVFSAVIGFFQNMWNGIKSIFSNVAGFFSTVFNAAKNVVSTIINGIVAVIKAPINGVIGLINLFIRGLNRIRIPDWVPAIGGMGIHINELPYLASGGVLNRGQVGILEGSGAEAVVPLENNKKWIAATARDLKASLEAEGLLGGGGAGNNSVVNNYNFVQNNNSPKALSRLEIYRQTRNQLRFARGV